MSGRYEREMQVDNKVKMQLHTMPEIITEYYYSLLSAGKSYNTAKEYICRIEKFIQYMYGTNCPEDFYLQVKSVDVNRYISSLRTMSAKREGQRISDSYRTVSWSALNSFFDFLVPDYIDKNPVANTTRPKMKDNPDVTFLTEEEVAAILDNVREKANHRMVNRDLCILKLGFSTGLRVSAISQIDISDIDFANNRIRVTEKGDKDYFVFIGDNLKNQINLWLKDRNRYFSRATTDALFVSQECNRISTVSIHTMIKKYSSVVNKNVTPHVMRHTCATHLYEQTGDIYLCANQLHHTNVSTTQRYAEMSVKKQRQATSILDKMI